METKPLCASSSNLADTLLTMVRVKDTMGIVDKCRMRSDATLCVVVFKTNKIVDIFDFCNILLNIDRICKMQYYIQ